jgi:hypothetical protein
MEDLFTHVFLCFAAHVLWQESGSKMILHLSRNEELPIDIVLVAQADAAVSFLVL